MMNVNIVQGEVHMLLAATRKGSRWPNHSRTEESQDPLLMGLYRLQEKLNHTHQLADMDVCEVIGPFCQIVQSDDTTGPVTGMAISSLDKLLAYNLIDPTHRNAPRAVEDLSEAVTHARFVGTNPASDEAVLMRILQVLRTLLLSPAGRLLTNESVCEIMQSCFRICFEMRLSELLRCFGESTLVDLVQLLFSQLPLFTEDSSDSDNNSPIDQPLMTPPHEAPPTSDLQSPVSSESDDGGAVDAGGTSDQSSPEQHDRGFESLGESSEAVTPSAEGSPATGKEVTESGRDKLLTPYSLSCVRELLRFFISLINTQDNQGNSDALVGIGLNLVTVVIECSSQHLCLFPSLAALVQDTLSQHLIQLLRHDSFVLFSRALRCCCLLFRNCRSFLKLQLEMFMNRLMELIATDPLSRVVYEKRELALESIIQLCHVPYFTAELFVNFDCGLYCTNVFESLTKLLSKNAFPTQGTLSYAHVLALEALLAIASDLEPAASSGRGLTTSLQIRNNGKDGSGESKDSSNYGTQINSAGIIFSTHTPRSLSAPCDHEATPLSSSTPSLSLSKSPPRGQPIASATNSTHKAPASKLASGYQVGVALNEGGVSLGEEPRTSTNAPTSKELLEIRQKKKLILAATELFNEKRPKEGIQFLCEQGILQSPPVPLQVADFLWENHALSKTKIGEYIGKSDNVDMLEAFVSKQKLTGVALLDALRVFLEAFRLPGEAQIVTRVLELFSQYWLDSNSGGAGSLGEMFENRDAVFVLSYSIMMLNTDLHNDQNKKKMTLNEYIRNQRMTNNGKCFPETFLSEIYHKIREEEIVLPSERAGAVKENYQWKMLLQRSSGHEGTYVSVADGCYAYDIFLITWGPTIAALSYIYDHADDKTITKKAISGFSKCASVAGHFELKEVFDKLIITLCKFTSLLSNHENSSSLFYSLGVNPKVKQSIRTTFDLAHSYGNILREGWKDLLDCLLALFKAQLLPTHMVQVSDFLVEKFSLYHNESKSTSSSESSLFQSFYSYLPFAQEPIPSVTAANASAGMVGMSSGRGLSTSEGKARAAAIKCIEECHPELLFVESRFLRPDALLELVKALIFASRSPEYHQSLGSTFDETGAVFFLGILVTVAIENKDRAGLFWSDLSSHLSTLILSARHTYPFLLERATVFLLHLVLRALGRGDFPIDQVLSPLSVLLSLPPPAPPSPNTLHLQAAHGVTEVVRTHATLLTSSRQWQTVYALLEFTGARLVQEKVGLPDFKGSTQSVVAKEGMDGSSSGSHGSTGTGSSPDGLSDVDVIMSGSFDLLEGQSLEAHEPQAFFKACECLSFLTRSDSLITASNFTATVRCIRNFAEVASNQNACNYDKSHHTAKSPRGKKDKATSPTRKEHAQREMGLAKGIAASSDSTSSSYGSSLLQLLDLLDVLYSKVRQIFNEKTIEGVRVALAHECRLQGDVKPASGRFGSVSESSMESLHSGSSWSSSDCSLTWQMAWCPILQGMARVCCCSRSSVRQTAITYLQRALLSHDLHDLSGQDWHACFTQVFFPMLSRLLEEKESARDRVSLEETRVRASNLLCKVFLQHLPSLYQKSNQFKDLWMHILSYMDKYLLLPNSELLHEAIPESLKNLLLVMSTQGIFDSSAINQSDCSGDGSPSKARKLWWDTWARIDQFLPRFLQDLFPNETPPTISNSVVKAVQPQEDVAAGSTENVASDEGIPPAHYAEESSSGSGMGQLSSESSAVLLGASPGSSPPNSHIPPPTSPVPSDPISPPSSPSMHPDPSFPVLHTPLPTLSPHQHDNKQPTEAVSAPLPAPMMGPILITAAPPYSRTNDTEPNFSVPFSSVQSS